MGEKKERKKGKKGEGKKEKKGKKEKIGESNSHSDMANKNLSSFSLAFFSTPCTCPPCYATMPIPGHAMPTINALSNN